MGATRSSMSMILKSCLGLMEVSEWIFATTNHTLSCGMCRSLEEESSMWRDDAQYPRFDGASGTSRPRCTSEWPSDRPLAILAQSLQTLSNPKCRWKGDRTGPPKSQARIRRESHPPFEPCGPATNLSTFIIIRSFTTILRFHYGISDWTQFGTTAILYTHSESTWIELQLQAKPRNHETSHPANEV